MRRDEGDLARRGDDGLGMRPEVARKGGGRGERWEGEERTRISWERIKGVLILDDRTGANEGPLIVYLNTRRD